MFHFIYDAPDSALGLSLESHDITWHQMALRALLTFIIILVIVRCAHKRFLGKATAFDVVLVILLGSIASRAITGNAPFFPALLSTSVLGALQWMCAWISFGLLLFRAWSKAHRPYSRNGHHARRPLGSFQR